MFVQWEPSSAETQGLPGCNDAAVLPLGSSAKYQQLRLISSDNCGEEPVPLAFKEKREIRTQIVFSFPVIWKRWLRVSTRWDSGVYGEHVNAAPRLLRRCFLICTPLFSTHPCFGIHKHSVQVKDSWRRCVYFIVITWGGFVTIHWFLLEADISLDNRISTVNAAWNAANLGIKLNFMVY